MQNYSVIRQIVKEYELARCRTRVGIVCATYCKVCTDLDGSGNEDLCHFEHVLAFVLLGVSFAYTYPHKLLVCCMMLGGAALLELAQTIMPDGLDTSMRWRKWRAGWPVSYLR